MKLLGRPDLLIVGAGPVGVAASWYARRYGLDAVAVDAAPHALQAVRDFAPGIVTASNAFEWEIDGLPLDCRIPGEVTREDLLSYYVRVRSYGQLRVACGQRVVGIAPQDDGVRVEVVTQEGPAHWHGSRVLVTSWFRRRRLDVEGVEVRNVLRDAAAFAGEDVVIFGAGLSGLEAADYLIRAGIRVSIVSRGQRSIPRDVEDLLSTSRASLIQRVVRVKVARPGFLQIEHAGGTLEVPCTVALNCTGQEIDPATLELLRPAGILREDEIGTLERFQRANVLENEPLAARASGLPVLSDALWKGRRGVHFAGAIHHVGGARAAGIAFSLETAHWVVASIAGRAVPNAPDPTAHLPAWFAQDIPKRPPLDRGPRWSEHVRRIIPLPVPTWSRGTRIFEWETAVGEQAAPVSHATKALGDGRGAEVTKLRELCYAGLSVDELVERSGLDPERLLKSLTVLWHRNGLTWVPPRRS